MSITVGQMRLESHALALYLLLCSDTTGDALNSFLGSGGNLDLASSIFAGIDRAVFKQAWQVISPAKDPHITSIKGFLATFKPVSIAASGFGYPDNPDACPSPQSVAKLLV